MLDGRGFSKTVKRLFRQPFDNAFMDMMNGVAKYLCENVQCVKKIQKLKETPTGEQVYRNEWVIKNATTFAEHKEQLKDIINGKQQTKITD